MCHEGEGRCAIKGEGNLSASFVPAYDHFLNTSLITTDILKL